jgi:hypothetical protein
MKKLLSVFGILALCLTFAGCDKDEDEIENKIEEITSNSIVGAWEITHIARCIENEDGPLEDFDYYVHRLPAYTEKWDWSYYYFNSDGTLTSILLIK